MYVCMYVCMYGFCIYMWRLEWKWNLPQEAIGKCWWIIVERLSPTCLIEQPQYYHRRRQGVRTTPLWKKIFEIDREIPLTRIFFLNWPWKSGIFDKSWLRLWLLFSYYSHTGDYFIFHAAWFVICAYCVFHSIIKRRIMNGKGIKIWEIYDER
jgi:hypothetical protein